VYYWLVSESVTIANYVVLVS